MRSADRHGYAVILLMLAAAASAAAVALAWAATAAVTDRDALSVRALRQAREALLAYAADRPIDAEVGPGYLPCPDRDGDGWAEPTCGSLSGDVGQAQRLGWLPWKTLGMPDLRDGSGERLWYAVSTRYKGLLNCAASRSCTDLSPPAALGTISVRDAAGGWVHDGRIEDPSHAAEGGAAAVIIAPGPARPRADGVLQERGCGPACPAEYLDAGPFEDNAAFVDRADARGGNGDGFVAGPGAGVNDRVITIGYAELMPRMMARVAIEALHCMRLAAQRDGHYPAPSPACSSASPDSSWGLVPDVTGVEGCLLAPASTGWWRHWRSFAWYATAPSCVAGGECIKVMDRQGRMQSTGHRAVVGVGPRPTGCAPSRATCDARGCTSVAATEGLEVTHAAP